MAPVIVSLKTSPIGQDYTISTFFPKPAASRGTPLNSGNYELNCPGECVDKQFIENDLCTVGVKSPKDFVMVYDIQAIRH